MEKAAGGGKGGSWGDERGGETPLGLVQVSWAVGLVLVLRQPAGVVCLSLVSSLQPENSFFALLLPAHWLGLGSPAFSQLFGLP